MKYKKKFKQLFVWRRVKSPYLLKVYNLSRNKNKIFKLKNCCQRQRLIAKKYLESLKTKQLKLSSKNN